MKNINNMNNYYTILEAEYISQAEKRCYDSTRAKNVSLENKDDPWNDLSHYVIGDEKKPIHVYRKKGVKDRLTIITDEEINDSNVNNVSRIELNDGSRRHSYIRFYVEGSQNPIASFSPLSNSANSQDWIKVSSDIDDSSEKSEKLDIPQDEDISLKELNDIIEKFDGKKLDSRYANFTNFYRELSRTLGNEVLILLSRLSRVLNSPEITPEVRDYVKKNLTERINSYSLPGTLGDYDSPYVRTLQYLKNHGMGDFTVRPYNTYEDQISVIPPEQQKGSASDSHDEIGE